MLIVSRYIYQAYTVKKRESHMRLHKFYFGTFYVCDVFVYADCMFHCVW